MTTFTLREYKKDGLYRSFSDCTLFQKTFDSLAACCNFLVNKYPEAQLVDSGSAGDHYLSIVETENEIVHSSRGFYRLNFVTD